MVQLEVKWIKPLEEEEPHYLRGVVEISGVEFYAEAWEVHDVQETDEVDDSLYTYQSTLPGGDNAGDDLLTFIGGDAQTIIIDGKDYIFAITPFLREEGTIHEPINY